jgi:hypothetical protein
MNIYHRYTKEVLYSAEVSTIKELVERAIREKINLSDADLRGANLSWANLCGANLSGADLCGAILYDADLYDADLSGADLCGADLYDADLSGADLCGAILYDADLSGADLSGANLSDADLGSAKLRGVIGLDSVKKSLQHVPEEGEVVGWKKCKDNVIVKLIIPAEAKRSNSTTKKCRAEYATVIEVFGGEVGVSKHDDKTTYKVGDVVKPDSFDDSWWKECAPGIHFFLTREEAEEY